MSGCLQGTPLASIQGVRHWLTLQEPLWIPSLFWVLRKSLGQAFTSRRHRWSSRSSGGGGVQAACWGTTAQFPGGARPEHPHPLPGPADASSFSLGSRQYHPESLLVSK